MQLMSSSTSAMRIVAVAFVAAALTSCSSADRPPPRESLQLSDVETVFFGFNNPAERVSDHLVRLYGQDSVPLEMTAGQSDEATLHVEVHSDADEEQGQGLRGSRCFVYHLDHATQQAQLEDLTTGACSSQSQDADAR